MSAAPTPSPGKLLGQAVAVPCGCIGVILFLLSSLMVVLLFTGQGFWGYVLLFVLGFGGLWLIERAKASNKNPPPPAP